MANSGLALVCTNIGGLRQDDDGNERYEKSPDCLENLRDLQRYLRRDNPETRDVFLELGNWNVVRQDLVPLIKRYGDDFEIVLNCVKILVFLTMPVDPTSHQVAKQVEYLQLFKAVVVEGDAIAVIVSHLEEPLQNLESGCPKDDDWKLFQLFLTLVRNFLSIPDCLPQHGPSSPQQSNLRDQMLDRLFNENAMELVVVLTQHAAGQGGLRHDNLLILEIIQQAFWGQPADLVAAAANKDVKVAKKTEKSAATLRALLQSERDQLKRLRKNSSPFTGMFLQVARDGSKRMVTRNPHQSALENLIRKPQVKRGFIKRIAQDPNPVFHSSDQIYVLLKDFSDQFLASGYNIKEDIRRERSGVETPDIVAFFQVAQFFTSYQCYVAQNDQKHNTNLSDDSLDGAEKEAAGQKHLCGLIASTMDEAMFTMVISKWHEFADFATETKDWKPLAAAGGVMKDMIRMLDLILKRSGSLTKEGQQELRTARILLYKVLYDQTDSGILHFLNSLIRSFDIYKQPRSHLADLVEITHIVLRILDNFAKSGESLRVLTKVRGGWQKKPKPSDQSQTERAEQDVPASNAEEQAPENDADISHSPRHTSVSSPNVDPEEVPASNADEQAPENDADVSLSPRHTSVSSPNADPEEVPASNADEQAPENDADISLSPRHTSVSSPNGDPERLGEEQITEGDLEADHEAREKEQSEVELEKNGADSSHEDEEDETLLTAPADGAAADDEEDDDGADDADGGKQNRTKEITLNIKQAVDKFANNRLVCNYCWLLKFHSTNRAATNHYIVRMLQRICEDCMLEPMLYQISILQTFYSVLSNKQMQAAEDHRFVNGFLSKLVRRLLKKLEAHPILFVDLLFWKNRVECHEISADYMLHSLRKGSGGSSQNRKRVNIADALGDDDDDQPTKLGSDIEGSTSSSDEDDDAEAREEICIFSEEQEAQIKDMFERYKDDEEPAQLIASELDPSGKYTAAQVLRKLQQLGLVEPSTNKLKKKVGSGRDKSEKGGQSSPGKLKKRKDSDGSVASRKSRLFSEAQDQALKELFERHGSGKNVTKVITENLGGEFTTSQVSRRLRSLGLVKPKPRTSLHYTLPDSEEDDDTRPRMDTHLSPGEEGNSNAERRQNLKRRTNSEDAFDSDGDDDFLASALSGPPSRQEGTGGAANHEEKRSRKRRIESVNLGSDDDAPLTSLVRPAPGQDAIKRKIDSVNLDSDDEAPLTRLVRPAPGQDATKRKVDSVNLDGDDDAPLTRLVRPAPGQDATPSAEHPRRRRVQTVDSEDSEEDLPKIRLSNPAPKENAVELEDSDDKVPETRLTTSTPNYGGMSGMNQTGERRSVSRITENVEDLQDSEDDVNNIRPILNNGLAPGQKIEDLEDSEDDVNNIRPIMNNGLAPGQEGSEGLRASIGGRHRKRNRAQAIDFSDSENED